MLETPFGPFILYNCIFLFEKKKEKNVARTKQTEEKKRETLFISTFAQFFLLLPFDSFIHIKEQNGIQKNEKPNKNAKGETSALQ